MREELLSRPVLVRGDLGQEAARTAGRDDVNAVPADLEFFRLGRLGEFLANSIVQVSILHLYSDTTSKNDSQDGQMSVQRIYNEKPHRTKT